MHNLNAGEKYRLVPVLLAVPADGDERFVADAINELVRPAVNDEGGIADYMIGTISDAPEVTASANPEEGELFNGINMLLGKQVHIAMITHGHGVNIYPALIESAMDKQVFEYVEKNWDEDKYGEIPEDQAEAISLYFEEHEEDFLDRGPYDLPGGLPLAIKHEIAIAACNALVQAYRDGYGNSIDWENVDTACALAREALGLPESDLKCAGCKNETDEEV